MPFLVQGGRPPNNSVTTDKLADGATTIAKLAAGTDGELITWAADASATTVAAGTATHVLTSNGAGSAPTFQAASAGGLASVQVFTATGTWTKPAGISSVRVQLVGGGAAGNHSGYGGGAGGYSEKIIDVSSISTVAVTVGASVAGNAAGNSSSFGTHLSATGGSLGASAYGGLGGVGTGGSINTYGGGGGYHDGAASSSGGSSYFGGGQQGRGSTFGTNTAAHLAYGGGGIGVYNGYTQGANSVGGLVVVWQYGG